MSSFFSQACENNKDPILAIIGKIFQPGDRVLEIGSGTTQHVRYFAQQLQEIHWQPTDVPESLQSVRDALKTTELPNIASAKALDVTMEPWPVNLVNGIFSANTLHIMPESAVPAFFRGAGQVSLPQAHLCVYGPFKYKGAFTSESNGRFDNWLKQRNALSGVRDFELVCKLAEANGFTFLADHAMPANNQLLVWRKKG